MKKFFLTLFLVLGLVFFYEKANAIPLGSAIIDAEGTSYDDDTSPFLMGFSDRINDFGGWHIAPTYEAFFLGQHIGSADIGSLFTISNLSSLMIYPVLTDGQQDFLAYAMGLNDPSPTSIAWQYSSYAQHNNGIDFSGYTIESITFQLTDFQSESKLCSLSGILTIEGKPVVTPEPGTLLLVTVGCLLTCLLPDTFGCA